MGNVSTHTGAFLGGSTLGAAVLGIMVSQFHMEPGLATNWLVVVSALVGGPVLAYLAVKAKGDPALSAALNAIAAISQQQQAEGSGGEPTTTATVTATTTQPAQASVTTIGSGTPLGPGVPTPPAPAPAVVVSPPQPAASPAGAAA